MILTISEIIDIIVMTLILGFIFKDSFGRFRPRPDYSEYDIPIITSHRDDFLFACLVTAPAIILHELGHKFVALSFGMSATFNAAYFWLGIGVLLKLMNFGFIFFVPAYVSISGMGTVLHYTLIAGAGPFVNLLLWFIAWLLIKNKLIKKKYMPFAYLTQQINLFLFIFNILPIPGFDGYKFWLGLIQLFV